MRQRFNNWLTEKGRNMLGKLNHESGVRFWINQELNTIKLNVPADYLRV